MISEKLYGIAKQGSTLLGIGPMSKNCVDATIELSNQYDVPLFLIASRRQIEASQLGGGYTNNWSTEEFANYVRNNDKKGNVILARDHGGPWQNSSDVEKKFDLNKAMDSAKKSYETDIESGFQFIHIDPSEDIFSSLTIDKIFERVFELYEFCYEIAKKKNKQIFFEVSVGKDSDNPHTFEEVEYIFSKLTNFCKQNNYPYPFFLAIRIGTHVMEARNIGDFESLIKTENHSVRRILISKVIDLCNQHKIMMKHHNTDYLSDEALTLHPKLGIHSANVAPEFGVIETRSFLNLLEKNGLNSEVEQFIDIAYNSMKWKKWMLSNNNLEKKEKAIIAGHYVFSNPEFLELKRIVQTKLTKIENIDDHLKKDVKRGILRYLARFNLI